MQSVNILSRPSPLHLSISHPESRTDLYKAGEVLESKAGAVWSVRKMVIQMTRIILCVISETGIILKSSPSRLHALNMTAYVGVGRPLS